MLATAQFLKQLREENHLTQEQLAEKVHTDVQTVQRWEEDFEEPTFTQYAELSELYQVTISELMMGARRKKTQEEKRPQEEKSAKSDGGKTVFRSSYADTEQTEKPWWASASVTEEKKEQKPQETKKTVPTVEKKGSFESESVREWWKTYGEDVAEDKTEDEESDGEFFDQMEATRERILREFAERENGTYERDGWKKKEESTYVYTEKRSEFTSNKKSAAERMTNAVSFLVVSFFVSFILFSIAAVTEYFGLLLAIPAVILSAAGNLAYRALKKKEEEGKLTPTQEKNLKDTAIVLLVIAMIFACLTAIVALEAGFVLFAVIIVYSVIISKIKGKK